MNKIKNEVSEKLVVERSKFFAYVYNVGEETVIAKTLKQLKKLHSSATHICYAYVIDDNDSLIFNYSDDREPSGTAGAQLLLLLKEYKLVNTLLVVVRYFGGVKLGVAGLGKAYKQSAEMCLVNNVSLVAKKTVYKVTTDYNGLNFAQKLSQMNNFELFDITCAMDVTFYLTLSEEEKSLFENRNFTFEDTGQTKYV